MPAGINISNPEKSWSGDVMTLSFKANKGIIGVNIKGQAIVSEDNLVIEIDLPAIVTTFVSEATIRNELIRKAEALLNESK